VPEIEVSVPASQIGIFAQSGSVQPEMTPPSLVPPPHLLATPPPPQMSGAVQTPQLAVRPPQPYDS
jgi:hypothetical protein